MSEKAPKPPLPPRSLFRDAVSPQTSLLSKSGRGAVKALTAVVDEAAKAKKVAKGRKAAELAEERAKRGRPSIGKPWEAANVSRRTWYRQEKERKAEGQKKGQS